MFSIYQKFPAKISTQVRNQICGYSLVVSQYPIIRTVFAGIKFPCRHTLFRVTSHVSVLAKLWVLFPYISYVNWHSSRILTARIFNKIVRHLLPFFNGGQGSTSNPWCIKTSNGIHIQIEIETSPRDLLFHVSFVVVKLDNFHENHSWCLLDLFVAPYSSSRPRITYRGLFVWFVNTFFMLDIKKLFL